MLNPNSKDCRANHSIGAVAGRDKRKHETIPDPNLGKGRRKR
jgi:hypothetical protein